MSCDYQEVVVNFRISFTNPLLWTTACTEHCLVSTFIILPGIRWGDFCEFKFPVLHRELITLPEDDAAILPVVVLSVYVCYYRWLIHSNNHIDTFLSFCGQHFRVHCHVWKSSYFVMIVHVYSSLFESIHSVISLHWFRRVLGTGSVIYLHEAG